VGKRPGVGLGEGSGQERFGGGLEVEGGKCWDMGGLGFGVSLMGMEDWGYVQGGPGALVLVMSAITISAYAIYSSFLNTSPNIRFTLSPSLRSPAPPPPLH